MELKPGAHLQLNQLLNLLIANNNSIARILIKGKGNTN